MDPIVRGLLDSDRWPLLILLTARIGGLMMTAPLWSMSGWPRAARAGFTILLAAILLPLAPAARVPEEVLEIPIPIAIELLIGTLVGLSAAVVVQGIALAGEFISTQMGLSFGALLAPDPELALTGVGQIQALLALAIYTAIGGHLMMLRGLAESLRVLPPGSVPDFQAGAPAITAMAGSLFSTGLRAAAPIVVALFLTQVSIGVLSRAVPQINAMILSFPITIGVGLITLWIALPILAFAMAGWLGEVPGSLTGALTALRPALGGR
jgi:flagellar biosynthetic protein FliR